MTRKDFQIWPFSFINLNGINILTGNDEECEEEVKVICYDGIALHERNGKFYRITYPQFDKLTSRGKSLIEKYCGYEPEAGEYGVICGALGQVEEISELMYVILLERVMSNVIVGNLQ